MNNDNYVHISEVYASAKQKNTRENTSAQKCVQQKSKGKEMQQTTKVNY
jgi:hypothetical protein